MKKGLILIIVLLFLAFVGLSTWFNCSLSGHRTVHPSVLMDMNDSSDKILASCAALYLCSDSRD